MNDGVILALKMIVEITSTAWLGSVCGMLFVSVHVYHAEDRTQASAY